MSPRMLSRNQTESESGFLQNLKFYLFIYIGFVFVSAIADLK